MKEICGKINHKNVIENKNDSILWDFETYTDRTIQAKRPDIFEKNYIDKTCFFLDMSVYIDTNL